jgi:hypothetical protein
MTVLEPGSESARLPVTLGERTFWYFSLGQRIGSANVWNCRALPGCTHQENANPTCAGDRAVVGGLRGVLRLDKAERNANASIVYAFPAPESFGQTKSG